VIADPYWPPVMVGMGIGAVLFGSMAFWDLMMGVSGMLDVGVALFALSTTTGLLWNLERHARHALTGRILQPCRLEAGRSELESSLKLL